MSTVSCSDIRDSISQAGICNLCLRVVMYTFTSEKPSVCWQGWRLLDWVNFLLGFGAGTASLLSDIKTPREASDH